MFYWVEINIYDVLMACAVFNILRGLSYLFLTMVLRKVFYYYFKQHQEIGIKIPQSHLVVYQWCLSSEMAVMEGLSAHSGRQPPVSVTSHGLCAWGHAHKVGDHMHTLQLIPSHQNIHSLYLVFKVLYDPTSSFVIHPTSLFFHNLIYVSTQQLLLPDIVMCRQEDPATSPR